MHTEWAQAAGQLGCLGTAWGCATARPQAHGRQAGTCMHASWRSCARWQAREDPVQQLVHTCTQHAAGAHLVQADPAACAALDMDEAVDLFCTRHPGTSPVSALAQLLLQARQGEAAQLGHAEQTLALLRSDLRAAGAIRQQLQARLAARERELGNLQNQARLAVRDLGPQKAAPHRCQACTWAHLAAAEGCKWHPM